MTLQATVQAPRSGCPKAMTFGPCGGVQADGACEVAPDPCVFLGVPLVTWAQTTSGASTPPTAASSQLQALLARRPIVVADLPARALDVESLKRCSSLVAGSVDAVLFGDTPWERVQFAPSLRARLIAEQGVRAWAGLNCRDRNRVALEGELAGLAAAGAAAVHCVTGDHTESGERRDATPVFDLDSTRLAALASRSGLLVSVAESPAAPPTGERAARLASKQRAGAGLCLINQAGGPNAIAAFVAAVRALAGEIRMIACVPLVISAASLSLVARFAGPRGIAAHLRAAVASPDPVGAGVRAAITDAEAMLAVDGIDGVELTVAAPHGEERATARAIATVGRALGAGGS